MGRRRWYHCGGWFPCYPFRRRHAALRFENLPKPKEADITDGVPYIDSEKESDILIVRKIDPCIAINGALHHTSKYELMSREFEPSLVVRRGQSFKLDIDLSRPYNEDTDGISFIFTVQDEDKPSHGQGTLIALPLMKFPDKSLSWSVVLENSFQNSITVLVTPSPKCIVAKWKLDIDTKIINDGSYSYSWSLPIYIICNPWLSEDQVYMSSEEWRTETVLENVGLIWRGTSNRLRPCIWNYGQFEKDILDCSLYLVKYIGKLSAMSRSDPVSMVRALSAAVNSVDDDGAIEGNWSNDYEGGTAPTKWVGSMEILQKFYKKKKPVKYGQCWVFSGVLTTICRSLGIPARTVTNYSSAHDTQSSLTVDYFMNEKGEVMEELNSDSIWNFHVWNEVWMDRPDLGEDYGGWQAIDATPQEMSDDMYKCGPSSVNAVKRGEILRPYDASFLFAEVNADKVYWRYEGPNQPLKLLRKDPHSIGKLISTKAPGKFEREDITHTYKYEETTEEERAIMLKALKQSSSSFSRYYLNEEFNDIYFQFHMKDDIKIGEPFDVSLFAKNKSSVNDYNINVLLRVEVVTYRGKIGDAVKTEHFNVSLKKNSSQEMKLQVTYEEYFKRLLDQAAFNISCLARVDGTEYEYYAQDDFRVRKPDVKIQLKDDPVEDTPCKASAYLVNPLPIPLRKGEFKIEGPGIDEVFKVKDNVRSNEKVLVDFTFTPRKHGKHTIAAKFTSKELDDCDGYLNFWVNFKKELENEV
ncbi:PREDICTED: annulin-like [Nicrophorus vespilloides]|uniref:Annulin-like n=1 Tax=Nicrophorus vespilloides TaxID=110193 RepID=A0ABM1MX32_NICVS|nr:PREDICTED: annulin-like [Nicrophorus vespilloides]